MRRFLLQLAMSSFAFLLSTLVSKASTAVNLGFVIFVVGWIMQARFPDEPTLLGFLGSHIRQSNRASVCSSSVKSCRHAL